MIGVLALQGGYGAHRGVLDRLKIDNTEVRLPRHLNDLQGLIIPGGESTTMLKLMDAYDLFEPIRAFGLAGNPILGTCAGAILMCEKVNYKEQKSLGFIPASIDRNAYGSQKHSFQVTFECPAWELERVTALFIRAPRFVDLGEGVQILSRWEGDITGVVYRNFTAVTYHPELGGDIAFHRTWLRQFVLAGEGVS